MNSLYETRYEIAVASLDELALAINVWANKKGFWDKPVAIHDAVAGSFSPNAAEYMVRLIKSQKIMLVVTELAELVEGLRKPADSSLVGYTNEEEEVADSIIRLLDYSGQYGLRIGEAVLAKMAFNEGRPYQHGKAF